MLRSTSATAQFCTQAILKGCLMPHPRAALGATLLRHRAQREARSWKSPPPSA
jgi:hypothetical protein